MSDINNITANVIEELEKEVAKLNTRIHVLTDDREHYALRFHRLEVIVNHYAKGLHADLTPTMMYTGDENKMYQQFCEYLAKIDQSVRGNMTDAIIEASLLKP